jgi:fused signal recognition particle receptor
MDQHFELNKSYYDGQIGDIQSRMTEDQAIAEAKEKIRKAREATQEAMREMELEDMRR